MKIYLTICLFFFFFCITSVSQQIECLMVDGTFNESTEIWRSRWKEYNGSVKQIYSSTNKLGCYVLQNITVNGRKCWKQLNGTNYIWYGHKASPLKSFDAWYIGVYPLEEVPRVSKSIPWVSTFIPNRQGYLTYLKVIDINTIIISEYDPIVKRVYLTQSYIDSITEKSSGLKIIQDITIKSIEIKDGNVFLNLELYNVVEYDIYKSTNLIRDKFLLIHSNLFIESNVWIELFNDNPVFYKIVGKVK